MGFSVSFKPIALIDIDEIVAWYEGQVKGLGKKFLESLTLTLDIVKSNPQIYQMIKPPVRRALVKDFPYKVLFFIEQEIVVVIGVIHFRRGKKQFNKRIK
jgi:toxin ParE1/3/4